MYATGLPPRYTLAVVTPPAEYPVSLSEAKLHLRVDHDLEDALISALVGAATEVVEGWLGRALVTRTLAAEYASFPGVIELPRPPLVEVETLEYVDEAGGLVELDADLYVVDAAALPGRVYPAYGLDWPDARAGDPRAVRVTYRAGYGTAGSDVPLSIRQAILLLVGHWYRNREAATAGQQYELPLAVEALLSVHRVGTYR